MKRYVFNIIQPVGEKPPPEELEKVMAQLGEIRRELELSEAWVFGCPLQEPGDSAVVRVQGDDVVATDGPYTEGKEHIGGLTIVKMETQDEALWWAGRYSRVTGLPVEVRPFQGEC
ncbi:YciI family protein [Actinomadura verrucosospora]|uniref:Ycii-like protein n=1 Tax=Actinomadura verrucosospora TaxID=46165 RepID=A0A7D4A062_ACTVE|nr:YciI family protein [Actinomadura verrucosospora]QKG22604.1 ycii-like protein [Actinomadura verrucosospora]